MGARRTVSILACALGVVAAMTAGPVAEIQQASRITPDGHGVGPQVGDTIPDFSLPDGQGRLHARASLMGPKGATIVFFRSADWCPPCKAHLIELQGHLDELRRDGMTMVAISRDSPAILAEFVKRHGITFPVLSDADSAVIKRFGVLDANGWVGTPRFGVPYRGTITVNHAGVVTSSVFQKSWQEHVTMASVLLRLGKGVDVPATKTSAPYLRLTSFTSDRIVTPGAHFMAVLDLTPASGIHVYAPGALQYLPLTLTIHPRPGLVVKDAQLPSGEDYFYKPLNEHVPVYQRPFRVTQELMVDPSADGQKALQGATSLTIEGTLEYQACSDTECFPPQKLPLTWLVKIGALDETRIVPSTSAARSRATIPGRRRALSPPRPSRPSR